MGASLRLLTHPALAALLRLGLGVVFVVAAVPKITDPAGFAQSIANYRLVPLGLLNLQALLLPWVELGAGLLLVAGIWTRANLLLVSAMLLAFIAAIGMAMARHLNISCGCFTTDPSAHTMTRMTLYLDVIWLGWAAHVAAFDRGILSARWWWQQRVRVGRPNPAAKESGS
jgi:uncharacterized membrane protein YphA (DoxX/SURF4 family)